MALFFMTPEEIKEVEQCVNNSLARFKSELERERINRETEALRTSTARMQQYLIYGMIGLWSLIIGACLSTCATHFKP
jgi:hypothetical protein